MELKLNVKKIFQKGNLYCRRPTIIAQLNIGDTAVKISNDFKNKFDLELNRIQPVHVKDWIDSIHPITLEMEPLTLGTMITYGSLVLQRWAGYPVNYGVVGESEQKHTQQSHQVLAYEFCSLPTAFMAGQAVIQLVTHMFEKESGEKADEEKNPLGSFIERYVNKPATAAAFVREADSRNIPWQFISGSDQFLVLGQGHKQRKVWRHFTGDTSHISTKLSTRKDLTNALFRFHGLPVPEQKVVSNPEEAVAAMHSMGAPVVVKPMSEDFGAAVNSGLSKDSEVISAFTTASQYGSVIVEKHIPGEHHRIMIINGKVVSARKQMAAHVYGDAERSVSQLVHEANEQRLANGWQPIPLDSESEFVLSQQRLTMDSVPAAGKMVKLRMQGNLSTGGSMEVVTDKVHPDNITMSLRAAEIMGIDVAGLDFITTDISRSHFEVGGGICEINVTPGFIFNEEGLLLDEWFPGKENGRIPVIVILDPDPSDHIVACTEKLLNTYVDGSIAVAKYDEVWLDKERIATLQFSENLASTLAVSEPSVKGVLVLATTSSIFQQGSGLDSLSILVDKNSTASQNTQKNKYDKKEVLSMLGNMSEVILSSENISKAWQEICGDKLITIKSNSSTDDYGVCPVCEQKIRQIDIGYLNEISRYLSNTCQRRSTAVTNTK